MPTWAEDACELIDAGFFSGDTFDNEDALKEIEEYIGRWQRECVVKRRALEEEEEEEECQF